MRRVAGLGSSWYRTWLHAVAGRRLGIVRPRFASTSVRRVAHVGRIVVQQVALRGRGEIPAALLCDVRQVTAAGLRLRCRALRSRTRTCRFRSGSGGVASALARSSARHCSSATGSPTSAFDAPVTGCTLISRLARLSVEVSLAGDPEGAVRARRRALRDRSGGDRCRRAEWSGAPVINAGVLRDVDGEDAAGREERPRPPAAIRLPRHLGQPRQRRPREWAALPRRCRLDVRIGGPPGFSS